MNNTHFVTYGDSSFIRSRIRILNEAMNSGLFCSAKTETPQSLRKNTGFNIALKHSAFRVLLELPRGGGYWAWKPWVVSIGLKSIKDGDFLVYADAGCTIKQGGADAMESYKEAIARSRSGIMAFEIPFKEKHWTKRDAFAYLGLDTDDITESNQLCATMLIVQKREFTMSVVDKWKNVAIISPWLFNDSPSVTPNYDGFKEHRHDQSIWSLLCKQHHAVRKIGTKPVLCDNNPIIAPTRIKE
jgi:hypothetical protein